VNGFSMIAYKKSVSLILLAIPLARMKQLLEYDQIIKPDTVGFLAKLHIADDEDR